MLCAMLLDWYAHWADTPNCAHFHLPSRSRLSSTLCCVRRRRVVGVFCRGGASRRCTLCSMLLAVSSDAWPLSAVASPADNDTSETNSRYTHDGFSASYDRAAPRWTPPSSSVFPCAHRSVAFRTLGAHGRTRAGGFVRLVASVVGWPELMGFVTGDVCAAAPLVAPLWCPSTRRQRPCVVVTRRRF